MYAQLVVCSLSALSALMTVIVFWGHKELNDTTVEGSLFRGVIVVNFVGCISTFVPYLFSFVCKRDFTFFYEQIAERKAFVLPCIILISFYIVDLCFVEIFHRIVMYTAMLSGETGIESTEAKIISKLLRLSKAGICISLCLDFFTSCICVKPVIYLNTDTITLVFFLIFYAAFLYAIVRMKSMIDKKRFRYIVIMCVMYVISVAVYYFTDISCGFVLLSLCLLFMFVTIQLENINMSNVMSVKEALTKAENLNSVLESQYFVQQEAYDALREETKRLNRIGDIFVALFEIDMVGKTFRQMGSLPESMENAFKSIPEDLELQSVFWEVIKRTINKNYVAELYEFTNLANLEARMKGRRSIQTDALNLQGEWRRYFFVNPEEDKDELKILLFVVVDINSDKQKIEYLSDVSYTDQLTGALNRNAYVTDIRQYKDVPMDDDIWFVEADINGLKTVNDTRGHEAGDELIVGTSACLKEAFAGKGRVYRVGGDEFYCLVKSRKEEFDDMLSLLKRKIEDWKGQYSEHLYLSLGFVSAAESTGRNIAVIAVEADRRMYIDKKKFYEEHPEFEMRHRHDNLMMDCTCSLTEQNT